MTSSVLGTESLRDFAESRAKSTRSEEHTSELQSQSNLVCRLLLEKKKKDSTVLQPTGTPFSTVSPESPLTRPCTTAQRQPAGTRYGRAARPSLKGQRALPRRSIT